MDLSNQEITRYSRHLIMPEVGIEGQKKLKNAKVLWLGPRGEGGTGWAWGFNTEPAPRAACAGR
ncbi:MAG: hypothetical protein F4235_04595, partial [Candidatus Dadabacteria bacterium]|nr:hypothetical protein [Candidatus Dadabacteria bacterium]